MTLDESWEYAKILLTSLALRETDNQSDGVDAVAARWREAKAWLLPYFGPEGRIQTPVTAAAVSTTDRSIEDALQDLTKMMNDLATSAKYAPIWKKDTLSDPDEVVVTHFMGDVQTFLQSLTTWIPLDSFCRGRAQTPLELGWGPNQIKVQPGARLSRVLIEILQKNPSYWLLGGYLSEEPDRNKLLEEYLVTIYSQLISRLKPTTATVVLSVNPIDMLLASLHTSGGWRSCHNLQDGCYRTGPLSYLIDDHSVVAFAYKEMKDFDFKDYRFPSVPGQPSVIPQVPVKLWRQMVYFYPDRKAVLHSREYPGRTPAFAEKATELSRSILSQLLQTTDLQVLDADDLTTHSPGGFNYADDPTQIVVPTSWSCDGQPFIVGAKSIPCLACGTDRDDSSTEQFCCPDCTEAVYCTKCGEFITVFEDSDDVYWFEGDPYCEDCYDEVTFVCDDCGETCLRDDAIEVANGSLICPSCFEDRYETCDDCGEVYDSDDLTYVESVDKLVCASCLDSYPACKVCGGLYPCSDLIDVDHSGELVCRHCYQGHFGRCEECGHIWENDDLTSVEVEGNPMTLCPACYRRHFPVSLTPPARVA